MTNTKQPLKLFPSKFEICPVCCGSGRIKDNHTHIERACVVCKGSGAYMSRPMTAIKQTSK